MAASCARDLFARAGRGRSSVGRAPQSHCGGQGFKSPRLHQRPGAARPRRKSAGMPPNRWPRPRGSGLPHALGQGKGQGSPHAAAERETRREPFISYRYLRSGDRPLPLRPTAFFRTFLSSAYATSLSGKRSGWRFVFLRVAGVELGFALAVLGFTRTRRTCRVSAILPKIVIVVVIGFRREDNMVRSRVIMLVFAMAVVSFFAPCQSHAATCTVVEGTHKYNSAGDQVGRCQPLAKRTHYKVIARKSYIIRDVPESERVSALSSMEAEARLLIRSPAK